MPEPIVSTLWLNENLNNPDLIILDSSPKENKSGLEAKHKNLQIIGARYFDLDGKFSCDKTNLPHMLPVPEKFEEESRKLGINTNSLIVVYDNIGVYASPRTWWMFKIMGHQNVYVLDGGISAWIGKGLPVEEIKSSHYNYGNFKASLNPNLVRNLDFIKENLSSNFEQVIDARSAERFHAKAPEPREGLRSGHIPNSLNLPFQSLLRNGKFKSKNEIKELFDELNIDERPLIFSCGSGLTACITFLAAKLVLKNDQSIYDGSWTEYAQDLDAQIEK